MGLDIVAAWSGSGITLEPSGARIGLAEQRELTFDLAGILGPGQSVSSPSVVLTEVPAGSTVTLTDDPTVDGARVSQIIDGSALSAASTYVLALTVDLGAGAVRTMTFVVSTPDIATSTIATTSDLDTFLGFGGSIDTDRAQLLLDLAEDLCQSVKSVLPKTARATILTVAARAYVNPTGASSETVGPNSVAYTGAAPGIYLTKRDVAGLRRLSGKSGAFSIDPTPSGAMRGFRDPLAQPTDAEALELLEDEGI